MKVSLIIFPVFLLGWLATSHAERILALFTVCSGSHKVAFMPIAEALAAKGHQVTVVSPFTPKKKIDNIREIVVDGAWDKELHIDWFKIADQNPVLSVLNSIKEYREITANGYKTIMNHEEIQEIFRSRSVDLVILSAVLNELALPIIDHYKLPFIFFSPPSVNPSKFRAMGVDQNYATNPVGVGDFTSQMMTFKNRAMNMLGTELYILARKIGIYWMLDDLARKDFPESRPIAQIERDAQLGIINYHPATAWPRPFPPNVIPIGPMHTRKPEPLTTELQTLADNAKDGFIVFTLGSAIPVSSMPPHMLDTFIRVFSRIPQLVFWKWEKAGDEEKMPTNVKTLSWVPQQDLLGHANVRLFITHGGLVGLQEAVYHGVPLLGLPFCNDQLGNLAKGVEEGYIIKMNWGELTETVLYDTIQTLLHNPSFKQNATRLSQLMKDEVMPAKDVAVYWVEHVLRHKGTSHLQSRTKQEMPFYQIYLLDIWLFLSIFFITSIYIILKTIKFMLTTCSLEKQKSQ